MEKITFKNGQAPYISDTNLNQMQNNIEEAINETITSSNVTLVENLAYAYKTGKVVNITIFGITKLEINNNTNVLIATLPEGYRPRVNISVPIILKDNNWNFVNSTSIIIRTTGAIEINQLSGSNITTSQILGNCTFITN